MKFSRLLLFVFTALFLGFSHQSQSSELDAIKSLPIQDAGRVKPFDSFARESLQLIYGKQEFQNRPAIEVVMTLFLVPEAWEKKEFIQVSHRGLKEALKLPIEKAYFAPEEILVNDRLGYVFQELQSKRETQEKLNPYFQSVQRLQNQLSVMLAIKNGQAFKIFPRSETSSDSSWMSIAELSAMGQDEKLAKPSEIETQAQNQFVAITKSFVHALPGVDQSAHGATETHFDQDIQKFKDLAAKQNSQYAKYLKDVDLEAHYNSLQPFMWTWIFYLVAAILMAFAWLRQGGTSSNNTLLVFHKSAWFFALLAFALHTYGFSLRVYLAGRPPVSNMYESVVWVSWGCVLFSLIFEYLQKKYYILISGAAVGVLCLIVASLAPAILDSSIQPLEPVLRSNFWLTVHVLTITLSYSAFFLSFAIADLGLIYFLKSKKEMDKIRSIHQAIYRVMQVGVVLLAAGIILGGVWADYSWGRFWGWDPKETWALIALLGYIAILHGRLAGWLREFGFIAASVVSFSLVLMAWYGVNYVLGAGLHSYGFGAGGVQYVTAFVLAHLLFVLYVGVMRNRA